jgi:predicted signal transduction protein with EAL and GGDEF domain/DNA-binding LacI/PurR family transcriptional regulator
MVVPPRTVIGVLTPFTGGFYYGAVLEGILRTAQENDAVAIAFETGRLRLVGSGETDERILSSRLVSGWLAVNEFDDPLLLARLRERGQPVIHVHARPKTEAGCAVLPDNEDGTRAATEHLIHHGHARIAFAGCCEQADVAERFAGYQAALAEHGLAFDPGVNLGTPWNLEADGRIAAARLLALRADRSCSGAEAVTAVVCATDKVALGLMGALAAAGLRLPHDLAVTGFDDTHDAQFAEPSLTTVRQNFAAVAATAVRHLLAALRHDAPLPSIVRVPTQLIVRRSCACVVSHSRPPRIAKEAPTRAAVLTTELLRVAGHGGLRDLTLEEWPGAAEIAAAMDAAVRGDFDAVARVIGEWWSGFLERNRDAESLVRVMALLESTLRGWCDDLDDRPELGGALRDVHVALIHAWQRSERVMVAHYESVSEAAYRMNSALAGSGADPSRDLSWIRWSHAQRACCAVWRAAPSLPGMPGGALDRPRDLQIVGDYRASEGALFDGASPAVSPEDFPPADLLDAARLGKAMLTVASVPRAGGGEYGLLAVVATLEYEQLDYVGNPGDWAVQLGAALDRASAENELRTTAALDALTGLANRATLLEWLETLRTTDESKTFAVLFVDLDDFKKVNDSLGHDAGDRLLIEIGARLTAEVRRPPRGARTAPSPLALDPSDPSGMVARLGGDEFVVVLPTVETEDEAIRVAQRLQDRLREPYALGAETVFVSGSIGVNFGRGTQFTAHELLRDADTAMYRAKVQGRARHEVFHHGMHLQAVEKLRLDARLRHALECEEFELWYQPIVALATGRDVGAEALVRWRHPEQGLLGPGRFLAVAEDVGLSIPISEWVIRRACAEAVQWQTAGNAPLGVNVNVPAAHVKEPGFVDFVARALADAGLSPRALGVEIVESTLMDEPARCAEALNGLMSLGVRIAIDDFGTGYSSLSYLRDFPASTLKIDRSFVKNLPASVRDSGIAKAIIAMGQGLGLGVVAEGIETKEQLQFLTQAGCDFGQGYYLARPMEFAVCAERLLRAQKSPATGGPERAPKRQHSSNAPSTVG